MIVNRKEYFEKILYSTTFEEIEDKLQNEIANEIASLSEKVEMGKCWYPVYVFSVQPIGSKQTIQVRRADLSETKHSMQVGNTVRIFNNIIHSNHKYYLEGKIKSVSQFEMSISVDSKEYYQNEGKNSWLNNDDLAVEQIYTRKGYGKMTKALEKLQKGTETVLTKISDILIGNGSPTRDEDDSILEKYDLSIIKNLNEPQQKAIKEILRMGDVSLILGPPGTGKTTTIVHAIKVLTKTGLNGQRILVTAQSNTAVDVLARKLHEVGGINVLRLGNADRIDSAVNNMTLSRKIEQHPDFPLFDNISIRIQRRFEQIQKTEIKPQEREDLEEKNKEDTLIKDRIFKQLTKEIFKNAQVVACTLEESVSQELIKHYENKYDYTFIDEAGQALEPLTWLPITHSKKVILIGDHNQLPPVVKSPEMHELDLNVSLFEKTMKNGNIPHNLLSIQYRMHEKIMNFSNHFFYEGLLQAAPENKYHTIAHKKIKERWNSPFEFIDTCNCSFREEKLKKINTSSVINPNEGLFLLKHLEHFITQIKKHQNMIDQPDLTIGIITPYRQQLDYLEKLVKCSETITNSKSLVKVTTNTIDGFQGQEQDVIYLSLVRSNEDNAIGFLKEYRRMNVAITRAKKKVVIIGDGKTLAKDDFFANLKNYARKEKSYYDAKELTELELMTA